MGRWGVRAVGLAALAVALAVVPAASSIAVHSTRIAFAAVGVSDDATKYAPDGGAELYARMKGYGLTSNRISVYWDFANPAAIPEKQHLDRVVAAANAAGVQLVFALFADPRIPGSATAISQGGAEAFCNYAALIARTYPSVTKIIVGNEPNQPRFWRPQFGPAGEPLAAKDYEAVLARCYDALKAVNPGIDVIGVGLSPRGNDDPSAPSNVSTSPVRFVHALAAAYRASGRTAPLMDELSFHCYPNVNTDSLQKGYRWPNVGCVNLDRLKQALWDGFNGTAQPTPLEPGLSGARPMTIVLDETGWQVDVAGRAGYTGSENVPTVDESTQASIYAGLVRIALCDPAVTALHFLYLSDATALADFQSGILRGDGSERPAVDAVRAAISRGCGEATAGWTHARAVEGAAIESVVDNRPAVVISADEDYTYIVTFTKGGLRTETAGRGKAYYDATAMVPAGFAGGRATVTIRSSTNSSRLSTYSFVAGVPSKAGSSSAPPPPPTAVITGTVSVNGRPFSGGVVEYGSNVDVTEGTLTIDTDLGHLTVHGAGGVPSSFELLRPQAGIVELRLVGGKFAACSARVLTGAAKKKKVVRLLWATGKGKFRTKGRDSTASVHGTYWLTEDRCDGTRTFVRQGVVTVQDFGRRKSVAVPAGRSYLALHRAH